MILVDTSAWIANIRDVETAATKKLDAIQPLDSILVGDLVLLEILQGARDREHANRLETLFENFAIVELMDKAIAVAAASNYRELRALGITVRKTTDLIIATFCIVKGHWLLHDDRDYDGFERHLGLRCL